METTDHPGGALSAPPAIPVEEMTDEQVAQFFDGLVELLDDPHPHTRPKQRPDMKAMRSVVATWKTSVSEVVSHHNGKWLHDLKHAAGFRHK